jgi:hypothetical protein
MAAARERLGKHVPAATDTNMRIKGVDSAVRAEELLTIGATKLILYWNL